MSLARRIRAAPAATQGKPAKPPKHAEAPYFNDSEIGLLKLRLRENSAAAVETQKKRGPKPRDDAKVQITLRLDPDVIAAFRAKGPGWQAMINEALKASLTRP